MTTWYLTSPWFLFHYWNHFIMRIHLQLDVESKNHQARQMGSWFVQLWVKHSLEKYIHVQMASPESLRTLQKGSYLFLDVGRFSIFFTCSLTSLLEFICRSALRFQHSHHRGVQILLDQLDSWEDHWVIKIHLYIYMHMIMILCIQKKIEIERV